MWAGECARYGGGLSTAQVGPLVGRVHSNLGDGIQGPKVGSLRVENSLVTYHLPFQDWEEKSDQEGVSLPCELLPATAGTLGTGHFEKNKGQIHRQP